MERSWPSDEPGDGASEGFPLIDLSRSRSRVPLQSTSNAALLPDEPSPLLGARLQQSWPSDERGDDASEIISLTDLSQSRNDTFLPSTSNVALIPAKTDSGNEVTGENWLSNAWRCGAISSSAITLLVLVINVVFVVRASRTTRIDSDGVGVLKEGTCTDIRRASVWYHLAINILSTAILSGSNYCMQCLVAPTRADIDLAHQSGKWCEVGVPSFRNLKRIKKTRVTLWMLLMISTLPLHLIYNSTIFESTFSNHYYIYTVDESFVNGALFTADTSSWVEPYIWSPDTYISYNGADNSTLPRRLKNLQQAAMSGNLSRLSASDCIDAYAKTVQTKYGDVLLVGTRQNQSTNSFISYTSNWPITSVELTQDAFDWICDSNMTDWHNYNGWDNCMTSSILANLKEHPDEWTPFDGPVIKYCLATIPPEHCKLGFSLNLAIVVIISNALKFVLMCMVSFRIGIDEVPLVTVGDAVASFLTQPDETTKGMCNFKESDFAQQSRIWKAQGWRWKPLSRPWADNQSRIVQFAGRGRVISCTIALLVAITVLIFFLAYGQSTVSEDFKSLLNLGFDAFIPETLITGWRIAATGPSGIVSNVLVANAAQPILSCFYLLFNATITNMLVGKECAGYAQKRQGLRVSSPRGAQRKTYFLSLPYRFSIPLIALSAFLHWLASQAISFVKLDYYSYDFLSDNWDYCIFDIYNDYGNAEWSTSSHPSVLTCSWNPAAIFSMIITVAIMIIFLHSVVWRKVPRGVLLGGSCSAVLSAACHPLSTLKGSELARRPLQWGAVTSQSQHAMVDGEPQIIGHLSFSDESVEAPQPGMLYAGLVREE